MRCNRPIWHACRPSPICGQQRAHRVCARHACSGLPGEPCGHGSVMPCRALQAHLQSCKHHHLRMHVWCGPSSCKLPGASAAPQRSCRCGEQAAALRIAGAGSAACLDASNARLATHASMQQQRQQQCIKFVRQLLASPVAPCAAAPSPDTAHFRPAVWPAEQHRLHDHPGLLPGCAVQPPAAAA